MCEDKSKCNGCSECRCEEENQSSCHDQSHRQHCCHNQDEKIAEPKNRMVDLNK